MGVISNQNLDRRMRRKVRDLVLPRTTWLSYVTSVSAFWFTTLPSRQLRSSGDIDTSTLRAWLSGTFLQKDVVYQCLELGIRRVPHVRTKPFGHRCFSSCVLRRSGRRRGGREGGKGRFHPELKLTTADVGVRRA